MTGSGPWCLNLTRSFGPRSDLHAGSRSSEYRPEQHAATQIQGCWPASSPVGILAWRLLRCGDLLDPLVHDPVKRGERDGAMQKHRVVERLDVEVLSQGVHRPLS